MKVFIHDFPIGKTHRRRERYAGKFPRRFDEKYKELNPERYSGEIVKTLAAGHTPAGMHRPICVEEILRVLHPAPGEIGMDATLGYGGHARELLARIAPGGRLFATDVDPLELPKTVARLAALGFGADVLTARHMNFAGISGMLAETGGRGFDFLLADLGVSSMQIDDPKRGFTFREDGPLDLRLDPTRGLPVSLLLRRWSRNEIEKMLTRNADEPHAALLADSIFSRREELDSTAKLAAVIRETLSLLPHGDVGTAVTRALPRVFQAFRIAVNGEFSALEQLLNALSVVMAPHGRVAILTFHPGEDDRVRRAFESGIASGVYSEICPQPIRPTPREMFDNPRSKCARLRFAVLA